MTDKPFDHQKDVPTAPVNVTANDSLGEIRLSDVVLPEGTPPLIERPLRLRKMVIGTDGIVPSHSHENRPAIMFIAEGEITEYHSEHAEPRKYTAPVTAIEHGPITHWWKNHGEADVVIYVADIYDHVEAAGGDVKKDEC